MPQMCVSLQKYPKMYVVIYLSARSWTSWIWHFEIAFAISAVWDETTDIHYFLWLSSSYAEVELRIFWRNVGKFPKISRPLRHIKFWNMIGIWSVTWLFRTKKSSESSPTDVNKMAGYWLVISHRHDGTVMVLPLTCCLAAKWVQYSPH